MATVESLQSELETLRSSSTRQQIESEQALHELTNQLQEAEKNLSGVRAECDKLKESGGVVTGLEATIRQEREDKEAVRALLLEMQKAKEQVEREKRGLLEVVERTEEDKKALEETLASLRTTHVSLQSSHSSLEASLSSSTAEQRTTLLRLQTLQSTINSLTSDKDFLTAELNRSRSEWSEQRRTNHDELLATTRKLEESEAKEKDASGALERLKAAHEALKQRYETTIGELSRIKEEKSTQEKSFVSEMDSMRRLVEMLEKRESERKDRMNEVEASLENDRRIVRERDEELEEDLRKERERCDYLEEKLRNQPNGAPRSATPALDDPFAMPITLSPSAQAAVRGQKAGSGKSYAEIYSEYVRMQEELVRERAETKRLGDVLEQILADIEERAPLLKEQRMEYDRLSSESTSLATQLASTLSSLEASQRQSESYRLDVNRLTTDNTLQQTQLQDLSRQLRSVMRQLGQREYPGIEGRSEVEDEEELAIRKRVEESGDTASVVAAHLVTFADINGIQVLNQKLLKIVRELGERLERGEEGFMESRKREELQAVEEAHEVILRLKEELENGREREEASKREREMLRRLLASGKSGSAVAAGANLENGGEGDAARLLLETQKQFEVYKEELGVDMQRLRDDLQSAQRELAGVRTEASKERAKSEFLQERFRLLTETYELQSGEMKQLEKRSQQVQLNMARRDSEALKATEDLLSLRNVSEQLRSENTNLKSEREVWKTVENRLVEDNLTLNKERSHLADLMRNLQTMQNELERSGTDSRRRLEENAARLGAQTADLKDRLNAEMDASRQLALRKEVEAKTYQDRVDKMTAEYQTTRESLVAAKTSQEHLETRIADLVLQVSSREEKLAIYEGRRTGGGGEEDSTRSREEQLEVFVADLRAELRAAKSELERANVNVQQYQAIAETQGESLKQITATYDEFKLASDASVAEKESELASLRERLHSLTTDLTAASTQNSELHRQIETDRAAFEKERKTFEDGLVNLRAADQTAREAQLAAQDDVRRQAQLAKEAHEKYDRELVAHADDVKRLTEIKDELETVRVSVREYQTGAEVAKANLTSSEASWLRQKEVLEKEVSEMRHRTNDLNKQNAVLHEHLESFNTRAATLQAPAEGEAANPDSIAAITANHDSTVDQLREVIRYLRREKDIIDLQLEFSKQEAARLRQQLEFTTRSLDEARQSLAEERQKSGESATSSAQHTELLERIHTAQLLRESNQTLRDENEGNMRKAAALDAQLRQAQAELDPLKEQVRSLQAEVESKAHNVKLLEEDNERWKSRNQTILAKYERIDPEELSVLKTEVDKLTVELSNASAAKTSAEAEQAKALQEKEEWRGKFLRMQTGAREQRDQRNAALKELQEAKAALEQGNGQVSAATTEANAELERIKAELELEKAKLEAETTRLSGEVKTQEELAASIQARFDALVKEKDVVDKEVARLAPREKRMFEDNKKLFSETKVKNGEIASLQKQVTDMKTEFETKNAEAIEKAVEARIAAAGPPVTLSDEAIEEAVKTRVAAAEVGLTAQRDAAIAEAVKAATTKLEADVASLRTELAKSASSGPNVEKITADLKAESEKKLATELEKVRAETTASAKAKEDELTKRLSEETSKAVEAAKASTATGGSTVDVDALVASKLASLEAERSASQAAAIKEAVDKSLASQAAEHATTLQKAREEIEKEAGVKNKLLQTRLAAAQKKAASLAPPVASSTPTSLPAAPAPTPGATPASTDTNGSGGAAAGAGRGRGGRGRGRGAAGTTPPSIRGAAGTGATAPSIALRGASRGGAKAGGGVLGSLLASNAAANASVTTPATPKRAREDDPPTDGTKRMKPEGK